MSNKSNFSLTLGAALLGSMAVMGTAQADNPFGMQQLSSGYMQLAMNEGKCGEGKCGGSKSSEGKCGEGKCGGSKSSEGKCGEGKCGGSM
jgi:uncharacterized low-complexity protein